MNYQKVNHMVDEIENWIIGLRRDFHRYPELSREEFMTSKKIVNVLKELGVEVKTGYYNTGVVGIIRGGKEGKTIGLRFDMDALNIEEMTDIPYKSKNDGVMHACGHDGHMAMGLGVARVLMKFRHNINGTIKLIFQPAEEDGPNGGGAQYMIKDGVLENPKVDHMVGMHIWPHVKFGEIGTKPNVLMASSDPIIIDITGIGSHASFPNMGIDPIVIGSQIITNIQTIVSRNIDPFEAAVISIGVFNAGSRYNVIPEKVKLEGTVRTFNNEVRQRIYNRLKKVVEETASALGGKAELKYKFSYPPLINDEKIYKIAKKSIEQVIGKENFVTIQKPEPSGEDFAYFAKQVPSVYLLLGYEEEGKKIYPLHSPYFNFNEKILKIGTKALTHAAISLGKN